MYEGGQGIYLNDHTALDEVIKCNCATPSTVKLPYQYVVESVGQPVAKASHCYKGGGEVGEREKCSSNNLLYTAH